jgi:hypothetical protein
VSGYPIFRLNPIAGGVAGSPKALIFTLILASNGPKPAIGFRDAINNDIIIIRADIDRTREHFSKKWTPVFRRKCDQTKESRAPCPM